MHNFFKIFEIDESYSIEKKELDSKYYGLLGKYHPDKATALEEKNKYIDASSIINNGYKILLDDFERAAHILELHGTNIKDDKVAPKLPHNILEEILSLSEEAEFGEKNIIIEKCQNIKKQLTEDLKNSFDNTNYQEAAIKAMYLKYIQNLLNH